MNPQSTGGQSAGAPTPPEQPWQPRQPEPRLTIPPRQPAVPTQPVAPAQPTPVAPSEPTFTPPTTEPVQPTYAPAQPEPIAPAATPQPAPQPMPAQSEIPPMTVPVVEPTPTPAPQPAPTPPTLQPPVQTPTLPETPVQPTPAPAAPAPPAEAPVQPPQPFTPAPAPVSTPTEPPTPATTSFSSEPSSPLTPKPASAATPSVEASFTPAVQHIPANIAEQIGEVPQQNSHDIEQLAEEKKRGGRLKGLISFLVFVAIIIGAAFLINQFIFQSYYVDGTSMTPTLQNNDRLIIDKVEKTWAGLQGKPYIPKRGQIIVLDSSLVGTNGQDEELIKRVIGLPGDTVDVANGKVTVKDASHPNGFDVDKQLGLNLQPAYTDTPLEVKVPDNQVFVMGDNRGQNGSYDSRAFGPIETSKIQGRLWARILPLNKAKIF